MPRQPLPRIPEDLKNLIYETLCDFGSARRRALVKYACLVIKDSDYIKEEHKERSVEIADQILQSLHFNNRVMVVSVANEDIVFPLHSQVNFEAIDAFEAYITIVEELSGKGKPFWMCHAAAAAHPYDFVFGTPETTYRVLVYNTNITAKINFMNMSHKPEHDRDFTTLFIVTEAYINEDFSNLDIAGKYRLAFIAPSGKDKVCILGDLNLNGVTV